MRDARDLFEGHHRGLKGLLLQLDAIIGTGSLSAASEPSWHAQAQALLDEIETFAGHHFADEEKLMGDAAYPRLADHHGDHARGMALLQQFRTRIETDGPHSAPAASSPHDDLGRLISWWHEHSHTHDHALSTFLCRGGI